MPENDPRFGHTKVVGRHKLVTETDVHYLDDRRVGGWNPGRQLLQTPVICKHDLIEAEEGVVVATIDPSQVTCSDCQRLL